MDNQTQNPPTPPSTPPTEPAPAAPNPGVPVTPAAQSAAVPTTPDSDGKKKKILLVEDDQGLASVYITRLQAEGFDVKHVPNGEDALAVAMAFKPDLVVLDVMMPKISGFDVLDIFRNTPETTNLKVVMLTALGQDADKERALSLGVDDYLVKSQVVIAEVVDRIKHHLGS
jgi:DNA-binding response OmpR family regulator